MHKNKLKKNTCKLNARKAKKIIYRDHTGFMTQVQRMINIQKSIKAIYPISTMKITWLSHQSQKCPLTKYKTPSNKSPEDIRDTMDIPKPNKGSAQQAYGQNQIKWKETQSNPTKIRNKIRLSFLSLSIQYST